MTNQTATTCEALRIFHAYEQAILDYDGAGNASGDDEFARSYIEGVCAGVILRDFERDAFDRVALNERALSFAKCGSFEGALTLFVVASRISKEAVDRNLLPLSLEEMGTGEQALNTTAYEDYLRRAKRMQIEAIRYLLDNGHEELGAQMLTVLEIPRKAVERTPINSLADFIQAVEMAEAS
jgi:hypothetical protein